MRAGAGRQDHLRADPGHGGQVLQHPDAGGVERMRTSLLEKIRKIKIGPVRKLQKGTVGVFRTSFLSRLQVIAYIEHVAMLETSGLANNETFLPVMKSLPGSIFLSAAHLKNRTLQASTPYLVKSLVGRGRIEEILII